MSRLLLGFLIGSLFWGGAAIGQGGGGSDPNNRPFQGVVAMTPGAPQAAQRSVGFIVTTAGTVTFTMSDGSTITTTLQSSPALQTLPFAVTNVVLGTAVGTFWNLK